MKDPASSRLVVGLIGGIGSGKTLVSNMLQDLGCEVVDADRVGHTLLGEPGVVQALTERFGRDIVGSDGRVDRGVLARRAFADADSLSRLNEVVHRPLRDELARRIKALCEAGTAPAVVLDAALLLETDWHKLCDVLVFVDADEPTRRRRVTHGRGWTEDELTRREKLQKPLDIKREKADHVVENKSSVSRLRQQVRLLYQTLVHSAND